DSGADAPRQVVRAAADGRRVSVEPHVILSATPNRSVTCSELNEVAVTSADTGPLSLVRDAIEFSSGNRGRVRIDIYFVGAAAADLRIRRTRGNRIGQAAADGCAHDSGCNGIHVRSSNDVRRACRRLEAQRASAVYSNLHGLIVRAAEELARRNVVARESPVV